MKRRGFLQGFLASVAVSLELRHWAQASVGVSIEDALDFGEKEIQMATARDWTYYPLTKQLYRGYETVGFVIEEEKEINDPRFRKALDRVRDSFGSR